VIVVSNRVGKIYVGPYYDAFAFRLTGTLHLLEKLEPKRGRRFDLRAERIDKAYIDVYGVIDGRRRRIDSGNGQYIDSSRAVAGVKGSVGLHERQIQLPRFVRRAAAAGVKQQHRNEKRLS